MIGSDDVLACFIAGNAFTWDDWFRLETMDDSLQPTIDMLLNVSIFMWFGAVCPWHQFVANSVIPIYRLIPLGILVLLLRRLPMVLLFHKKIKQIEDIRHAAFVGFFGPIGVSAIFYLYVAREFLRDIEVDGQERGDGARLSEILNVVIWFLTVCSIFVHGLSIPVGKLGFYLPRTLSTAISSERMSASQSMARTDDSTDARMHDRSTSGVSDDRSLMRHFRRRRLTSSERGPVAEGTTWVPGSIKKFLQHIQSDISRPAGHASHGQRENAAREEADKDQGSSSSSSPVGHGGAKPNISAPRNARLIGHAINDPPVRVDDDDADGPRVNVRSPVQSPDRTRGGSPDRPVQSSVTPQRGTTGWQRSIRFGDEPATSRQTQRVEQDGEK
jgi:sodium/hydrogen antiporter